MGASTSTRPSPPPPSSTPPLTKWLESSDLVGRFRSLDNSTSSFSLAMPANALTRLSRLNLTWLDLSPMAQQALVWDMGLVVAAVNGVDQWLQVYVRTAGSTMADIAIPMRDFPGTLIACRGPSGSPILRQQATDYAALHHVTRCAVDFDDNVPDAFSAMQSQDGLRAADVPMPRIWRHEDPNVPSHRNMAIHTTPGGGLEPARWGVCPPMASTQMGLTIPCEPTTEGTFLPAPSDDMTTWLRTIASAKMARNASNSTASIQWPIPFFTAGNVQTTMVPSPPSTTPRHPPPDISNRVGLITAIVCGVVSIVSVVLFVFCAPRRHPTSPPPEDPYGPLPSFNHVDSDAPPPRSTFDSSVIGTPYGGGCPRESAISPRALATIDEVEEEDSTDVLLNRLDPQLRLDYYAVECKRLVSMTDTTAVYVGQYYVTQIAIEAMYDKGCLTPQGLRRFAEEICLMSTFSHPNVVALVGFAYQKNHPVPLLAATEFLPGGNLASFLRNTPDLPWCTKARLALDIVNALVYLHHTLAVIHRDVKTQHVLLNWPRAIVPSFGVSRQARDGEVLTAGVGSGYFMAPEVVRLDGNYSIQADMYSFGCVLVELDTQQPLFVELKQQPIIVMQRIVNEGLKPSPSTSCPDEIRALADLCLRDDPAERPTAVDAKTMLGQYISPDVTSFLV
ncbi:Aste57867_20794 [Aphanomyces stellatus]|uniref:Aste57867_20794 protein n=1 Tax=Aphanomyces stellatus TaxID=120398 RepID=A0A485LFT2_9STRA|nr:hypothetical protein As57867_020726 [Aphanomyces stellatus]VFT97473.1 Aste57867_20794 [Aphanomyces stellatus]